MAAKRLRENVVERVTREIVRAMYDEEMTAGERFLSEAEALERFGVSRGTLREALRFLQMQGVLDIRPGLGGGHFVALPRYSHLASTLGLLLQLGGATMRSLIEARSAIEPGMAELAARQATEADIAILDAALRDMEGRKADAAAFHEANMAFWDHLAGATRNPLFRFLSPALRAITETSHVVPDAEARQAVLDRLRRLWDAVAAGQADQARQSMTEIVASYREAWDTTYANEGRRIISWADLNLNS